MKLLLKEKAPALLLTAAVMSLFSVLLATFLFSSVASTANAAELPFTGTIDLALVKKEKAITFASTEKGDLAGGSVKAVGDFNGDGKGDFIVGASHMDKPDNIDAGGAYVVLGNGGSDLRLEGANAVKIVGANYKDHAGFSVSGAGDVNGDGLADVVIGAPNAQLGGERVSAVTGIAYLSLAVVAVALSSSASPFPALR